MSGKERKAHYVKMRDDSSKRSPYRKRSVRIQSKETRSDRSRSSSWHQHHCHRHGHFHVPCHRHREHHRHHNHCHRGKSKSITPHLAGKKCRRHSRVRSKTNPALKSRSAGSRKETKRSISLGSVSECEESTQRRCQLCSKVRQLRYQSANLTKPSDLSDVTVETADGTKFYCHTFVLDTWAPHLLAEKNKGLEEKVQYVIKVRKFSTKVVAACLRLMYGGTVDEIPLENLNELMELAAAYKVPDLKEACLEAASRAKLTPSNACSLWCFAEENHLEKLGERAMRYVFKYIQAVLADYSGSESWNELLQRPTMLLKLFFDSSEWTTSKSEPVHNRDSQMDELWNQSNGLRRPVNYSDITIVTKEGEKFFAHLAILSLAVPQFAEMLHDRARRWDESVIDDFDGDVVKEFLRILYRQEPSTEFQQLVDYVYVMACTYGADAVIDLCEMQLAKNQLHSVDEAMKLWQESNEHRPMSVTKSMCYAYFYEHAGQLRHHEKWLKLATENPILLAEMIAGWMEFRQLKNEDA